MNNTLIPKTKIVRWRFTKDGSDATSGQWHYDTLTQGDFNYCGVDSRRPCIEVEGENRQRRIVHSMQDLTPIPLHFIQ